MKHIGSTKQILVDDYLIEDSSNLTRGFHPPQKHDGNPLLEPKHPWEGDQVQANAVIYDHEERLYKMWYGGGHWACLATSEDGITWNKPSLGIKEHEGSAANNLIDGVVARIVYAPELKGVEPPERLYKTFFDTKFMPDKDPGGGWRGKVVSFSGDGLRWTPYEGNPVLVGALGDVNTVCKNPEEVLSRFALDPVPKFMKDYEKRYKFFHSFLPRYLAHVKFSVRIGHFDRRAVGISYSENFTDWSYPHMTLAPDERDDELADERIAAASEMLEWDHPADHHAHFYGMDVYPYAGMYLGFLYIFDSAMNMERIGGQNQSGTMHIELVTSRDLIHWERIGDREPFIPLGDLDDIDSGMIVGTHAIEMEDTLRFYYSAYNASHGGLTRKDGNPVRSGICLATSRLDGFASLGAPEQSGSFTTKELTFEGREIIVNADATGGSLTVGVLRGDRTEAGFGAGDCDAFRGNDVRHRASWKGSTDVGALSGKPVRLRFHLANARLYSFQFK